MRKRNGKMGSFCGKLIVLMLLAAFAVAAAQASSESAPPSGMSVAAASNVPVTDKQSGDSAATQTMAKPAVIAPNDLRQAQILADTQRLLQLAQELKLEVSKSNKEILSLAVVKKADEIDKLAKSLKERMRTE